MNYKNKYLAPGIKIIEEVLSYGECKDIIDKSKMDYDGWFESPVIDMVTADSSIRKSKSYNLWRLPHYKELQRIIFSHALDYAIENGLMFSHMETIGMLEYLDGQGFYKSHVDFDPRYPRSMSFLLYLNDVPNGGETEFSLFNIKIKPKSGTLALFPASGPYFHSALPPIGSNKIVLVGWFGLPIEDNVFSAYYSQHVTINEII